MINKIIQEIIDKIKSRFKPSNSYSYENNANSNMKTYVIGLIILIALGIAVANLNITGLFTGGVSLEKELNSTKATLESFRTNLVTTQSNYQTCQQGLDDCNSDLDNYKKIVLDRNLCKDEKKNLDECRDDLKDKDDLADDYQTIIERNGDIICCNGESSVEKSWELDNGRFRCSENDDYSNKVTCPV